MVAHFHLYTIVQTAQPFYLAVSIKLFISWDTLSLIVFKLYSRYSSFFSNTVMQNYHTVVLLLFTKFISLKNERLGKNNSQRHTHVSFWHRKWFSL